MHNEWVILYGGYTAEQYKDGEGFAQVERRVWSADLHSHVDYCEGDHMLQDGQVFFHEEQSGTTMCADHLFATHGDLEGVIPAEVFNDLFFPPPPPPRRTWVRRCVSDGPVHGVR